jgi:type VI protein secretion system component VasF
MKLQGTDDELLRRLRSLGVAEPDAARLERVRARCHTTLAQRRQHVERQSRRAGFARRVLEPALVGTLSAGYLLAMLLILLSLHGMR